MGNRVNIELLQGTGTSQEATREALEESKRTWLCQGVGFKGSAWNYVCVLKNIYLCSFLHEYVLLMQLKKNKKKLIKGREGQE